MTPRRIKTLFASFGSIAALAACGGSQAIDGNAKQDTATIDASTLDATTADSAALDATTNDASDSGTPEAAPFDAGDAAVGGSMVFSQSSAPGAMGEFFADFYEVGPDEPLPGCTLVAFGECTVTSCPHGNETLDGGSDASTSSLPTAGTMTIDGNTLGPPVAIQREGDVYQYYSPGALFSPGDTLSVAASGGDVTAFPSHTIVAPGFTTLTSPVTDGGTVDIVTSQDLVVTWTGGQTGATALFLGDSYFVATGGHTSLRCSWTAAAGQATVPQAALAGLSGGTGDVFLLQSVTTSFDAGAWAIQLQASTFDYSTASFQ
jgi:hypothetical protein